MIFHKINQIFQRHIGEQGLNIKTNESERVVNSNIFQFAYKIYIIQYMSIRALYEH